MLPEVAWAICAEDGEEPSEKVFVDLDAMVPMLAVIRVTSEEAYALIAAEFAKYDQRAVRIRIAPDEPEPEAPPKQKTNGIGDILARMDQRAAQRRLTNIKHDNSRRRVRGEKERKSA